MLGVGEEGRVFTLKNKNSDRRKFTNVEREVEMRASEKVTDEQFVWSSIATCVELTQQIWQYIPYNRRISHHDAKSETNMVMETREKG